MVDLQLAVGQVPYLQHKTKLCIGFMGFFKVKISKYKMIKIP